jgi:hypothetical protein
VSNTEYKKKDKNFPKPGKVNKKYNSALETSHLLWLQFREIPTRRINHFGVDPDPVIYASD